MLTPTFKIASFKPNIFGHPFTGKKISTQKNTKAKNKIDGHGNLLNTPFGRPFWLWWLFECFCCSCWTCRIRKKFITFHMGTHMQTHHINKDSHCKKKIEREGTCKRVEGFFCCFFTCQAPPSLCFICYFFYVLLNGFWFDWATVHMIFSKIVHSQLLRCFLKLNCKHNAETDWHWNRQSDGSVEHRQDKLRLQRKKPAKQTSTLNKKLCWRSRHHHHFFEDCIQAGRVHTRRVFLHISLAFFNFGVVLIFAVFSCWQL